MDKHSSEPWSAEFTDTPYAEIGEGWVVDGPNGSVCTLDGPKHHREHDARLIAAAPELLKALIAARDAANELGLSSSVFPRVMIEAAITKANGVIHG